MLMWNQTKQLVKSRLFCKKLEKSGMKNVRTASLLIVSFLLGLFTVSLMIGCSSDSGDDGGNNAPAVDGGRCRPDTGAG